MCESRTGKVQRSGTAACTRQEIGNLSYVANATGLRAIVTRARETAHRACTRALSSGLARSPRAARPASPSAWQLLD
jgi:hypothetical protein